MTNPVTLIYSPTLIPMAEMRIDPEGLDELATWVVDYRPECLPGEEPSGAELFPHDMSGSSDNELLVELAGRGCYHSYGKKAGRKTNADYIAHTQQGTVPHRSVLYHAKMSFFVAGVSRHLTHELMRHYVGADRDQEGSPSQESTRYTWSPGHFIVPPRVIEKGKVEQFKAAMQAAYDRYLAYVEEETADYSRQHGAEPKGLDRKRIYEAAAGFLPMHAATSLMWTTNPAALAKLFAERTDAASGLEFQRLAVKWRELCQARWPALFPADRIPTRTSPRTPLRTSSRRIRMRG